MPPKSTVPAVILPAASRMPNSAKQRTDFPEPDSPTMPTVSPFDREGNVFECVDGAGAGAEFDG